MDADTVNTIQRTLRTLGSETEAIEVKAARGGTPERALREAIVAFANREGGGTIVLGLDESKNFEIVGVGNVAQLMTDVPTAAREEITPPIPVELTPIEVDGNVVVVVTVPEIPFEDKPAYINARGPQAGAYIRVGASNRQMTAYETAAYRDFRAQRTYDDRTVETATVADLDQLLVNTYILEQKRRKGTAWGNPDADDLMNRLRITRIDGDAQRPTVAGLICFGTFPQQYLYQARIQFTMYAGTEITTRDATGARYVDAREFDGPVQEMIDAAVATIANALPVALYVDGVQHTRVEEIPRDALREALLNAIAHRDYGPYQIGNVIQVFLFSDRLEIRSPGGLHGGARITELASSQSTRNPLLMRLLLDMGLVENRGSGIKEMITLCEAAGLPEPTFRTTGTTFTVIFWRRHRVQQIVRTVREPGPAFDVRRMAPDERLLQLVELRGRVTNELVREELGLDRWQATRLLQRLVDRGLLLKHGEKRGVYYTST